MTSETNGSAPASTPDPAPDSTQTAGVPDRRGRIITFYSYKGGTGRSMMLANVAWILATASDHSLRNGTRAVRLAEASNRLSRGDNASSLRTLAAAHAENQDFELAVAVAQRALQLAREKGETGLVDTLQREIGLYQAGLPY